MPKASKSSRRPGRSIGRFLLVFGLGVCIAVASAMAAAVEVFRSRAPERALAISSDGRAIVRRIDNEMTIEARTPSAGELAKDARRALRQTPLNAGALRLLGLASEMRGDSKDGRRNYELAERVSRRDFLTELALVEYAVQSGDVPAALRHYDVALRTKTGAEAILFPILREALKGAEIQKHFAILAAMSPPWMGDFLAKTIRAGGYSTAVLAIADRVGGLKSIDPSGQLDTLLLTGLGVDRRFDLLRRYYLSVPGADRRALTSSGFDAVNTRPELGPVAWQLMHSEPLLVSFTQEGTKPGLLDATITLDPGSQVLVARKLIFLSAGEYRFRAAIHPTNWLPNSIVQWQIRCALTPEEPLIWQSDGLDDQKTITDGRPIIRENCFAQYIDLRVTASANGQDALQIVAGAPIVTSIGTSSS